MPGGAHREPLIDSAFFAATSTALTGISALNLTPRGWSEDKLGPPYSCT